MQKRRIGEMYQDEVRAAMSGRFDAARLDNMRSTSIGGASLSTALVFLLLQTDLGSVSLMLALFCSVIAIPSWIATWQIVEAYLFCGESSYEHFYTLKGSGIAVIIFFVAAIALLLGMCALLWHLKPIASILFGVLCVAMSVFVYWYNNAVRAWSDSNRTPRA